MDNKLQKIIKLLPDEPGIYLFYNSQKQLIYVGKATSLKNRVRSYFAGAKSLRPIEQMIHEVVNIKFIKTDSVLEAIILEGDYIKKFQPKYNVDWKDDKSWNYIIITKDKYPQVKTIREREIQTSKHLNVKTFKRQFGPYPGLKTRETMKILQRLFYISICKPNAQRPCLYYEMNQCLGVCTGEISPAQYKERVIKPLIIFLKGQKKKLLTGLEKQMKELSKKENYEEATRLRNQINALTRIRDVALLNKSFVEDNWRTTDYGLRTTIRRIEGYDISNLGGDDKVGSMVVFKDDEPDKNQYRKFKIKNVIGQSDVDCLEEIISRRLKHNEWTLGELFLIDGGLPQVNCVKKILKDKNINLPVVGIAKGPERKKNDFIIGNRDKNLIIWVNKNKDLLIKIRDEAHRFAIKYNRSLRNLKNN